MPNPPTTYVIVHRVNGQEGIFCRICGLISWSEADIKNLYCGKCNRFHNDPLPPPQKKSYVHEFFRKITK